MKPYACGESNIYIPDNDCACGTAESITTDPTEISFPTGNQYQVSNAQDNLNALSEEITYITQNLTVDDFFGAVIPTDQSVTTTATQARLLEAYSSENPNWHIGANGELVCLEAGYYEISAQATFNSSSTSGTLCTVSLMYTRNGVESMLATANAYIASSGSVTAPITPIVLNALEGSTVALTVNSTRTTTLKHNMGQTRVNIRKLKKGTA